MTKFSQREVFCIIFSLALHSLLILWKASEFKIPSLEELDPIVSVDYIEETQQQVGLGQQPGGASKEKKFIEKVKSFLGITIKESKKPEEALAGADKTTQLESKINLHQLDQPKLKNRSDEFKTANVNIGNLGKSNQDIISTTHSGIDATITKTLPSAQAEAKLENKEYKISTKQAPFEVASAKSSGQILSGDKVYVPVGGKTSKSVREISSTVSEGLEGAGSSGGGLVDRGSGGGSGIQTAGDIESRLAKAGSGGGGSLVGSSGESGGGHGGYGSGSTRGYGGTSSFSSSGGSGAQTISGADASDSKGSGSGGKSIFEITGELAGRKILKKKIPEYPEWAKREGLKARVALYFEVLSNGKVKNTVLVQQTSGYPELDRLTSQALLEWLFAPLSDSEYGKIQWGVITFKFDIK